MFRLTGDMMNIEFCERHKMLVDGDFVLAAVSGGKDSVFLLYALKELADTGRIRLACAHFDHSLRGEESDRDRHFVEKLCAELGIVCYTEKGDVAAFAVENKNGIEEAARTLRYAFLERIAEETGATKIATAHTADDNAETLLLNLIRGSGLSGLCAIPPVRGKIIRPMLEISTQEIIEYLNKGNIPYMEDSTNAEDDYMRNRLRHAVIPRLREINSSFDSNAARCIENIRADEEYLNAIAEDFLSCFETGNSLPARELAKLSAPIAARVIKKKAGGKLSRVHIEAVLQIAGGDNPHAIADLPGLRVRREFDRLVFGGESENTFSEAVLKIGEILLLPEAGLQIESENLQYFEGINNSDNPFFFQRDSICGNIVVRPKKEGDEIRIAGRRCTKTLKKLFSEARLSVNRRQIIPVIADECGPVAVYGFGIAQRCLPTREGEIICVRISETNISGRETE